MNSYSLGAVVRCTTTFSINGANADPSSIQAKIKQPSGTISTYTYGVDGALVRDSLGVYHVDVPTTSAGVWSYRFIGTGVAASANETEFFVDVSDFGAAG